MHQELKIFQGVYLTDYRKGQKIVGLSEEKVVPSTDVGVIIDELKVLQSQISQLVISNEQIKEEEKWEEDEDYWTAVIENLKIILRKTQEMKQKIIWLSTLKFHPQTEQQEKILNVNRLLTREDQVVKELSILTKQTIQEEDSDQDQGVFV